MLAAQGRPEVFHVIILLISAFYWSTTINIKLAIIWPRDAWSVTTPSWRLKLVLTCIDIYIKLRTMYDRYCDHDETRLLK
jgi:hypothetical protein